MAKSKKNMVNNTNRSTFLGCRACTYKGKREKLIATDKKYKKDYRNEY